MTFHSRDFQPDRARTARRMRGALAQKSGVLAEDQVAARYEAAGYDILARRWRCAYGEIDLIATRGGCTVFIEVKRSRSHELAALRLDRRQMDRICLSALEYCERLPAGSLSEMRMDVALVDELGRIDVIENAFGEN